MTTTGSRQAHTMHPPQETVARMVPTYQQMEHATHDHPTIESTIHTLSSDRLHPIALEFWGTPQGRQICIRAMTPAHLSSAIAQLRACYPQANIEPLASVPRDPFHVREQERVTGITLESGAASYLPLREWNPHIVARTSTSDPILGILAALDALPPSLRVVTQLAFLPAPDRWSQRDQRKALQHALEPERTKAQRQRNAQGGPRFLLLGCGLLLLCLVMFRQRVLMFFPPWVAHAIQHLTTGQDPQLTATQHAQLLLGLLVGGLLVVGCLLLVSWGKRHLFASPLYDMREVERKTSQNAYRVRLRLFAISPHPQGRARRGELHRRAWRQAWQQLPTDLAAIWHHGRSTFFQHMRATGVPSWRPWCIIRALGSAMAAGPHHWCHSSAMMRAWKLHRGWRQRLKRTRIKQAQWRQFRQDHLHRLISAYRQYHLASGNYFRPHTLPPRQIQRLIPTETRSTWDPWRRGWWQGVAHSSHFLTGQEIASLWHLPPSQMVPELALMEQRRMRTLLVPPAIAQASRSQLPLGISEHAGHRLAVSFPAECLHAHMLVVGKSGEGKSTGMEHLARAVMQHDGGMLILDPHGDLVDHVLELLPFERQDDVMIIDLADLQYSVGLNPLDVTIGRGRDKTISDLLKTLAHIWVGAWGSRMENAFEYALRTLYEANRYLVDQTPGGAQKQYTLLDVMYLLTSESFCHALLQHVTDPYIHRWWNLYYDPLTLQMQRDRIDPVLSKVAKFESVIARRIVGQSITTLHFAEAIAQRKLMFFKLSKSIVGEDMARILGATLLSLLNIALEEQGSVAQAYRRPLTILVDEFQVLEGVDWGSIAELRKYGATFFLATQSLDYLQAGSMMERTSVLSTVMSNVKQYMIFHVSAHDAAVLAPELGIEQADLLNLDSFTCYTKLTYHDRRQPTFSLHLDLPPRGDRHQAQDLIERSRRRYGVPVALIDEHLTTALITAISAQPREEATPAAAATSGRTPVPESGLPHPRRKAQEKRERAHTNEERTQTEAGEATLARHPTPHHTPHTTPMSWEETVGHLPDPSTKESKESHNA